MSKEVRYHLYFLETIVFWVRFEIERSPDEYLPISIDYTNVAVIFNFLTRTSPFDHSPLRHIVYTYYIHWCITRIKTSNESQSNECCTRAGFPSAWFRHAVYVYRLYISSYDLKLIVFKLCLSDIGIMQWYGTWCVYACAMIQRWYSSNRSLSRSSLFHPLSLSRRSTTMSSP